MCQRCADKNNDARHGAFQPIPMVESLSVKDVRAAEAGQPSYILLTPVQDSGEAKFLSLTMEGDPAINSVRLTQHVVCLN